MSDASVIAAARTKYGTLTAANFPSASRPSLYFDEVPVANTTATAPPFVVLKDRGTEPEYDLQRNVLEATTFTLTCYADTLADADTIASAIKYNGAAINAASGFDFGSFSGLATGLSSIELVRLSERRAVAGVGRSGQRVHSVELTYRAKVTNTL